MYYYILCELLWLLISLILSVRESGEKFPFLCGTNSISLFLVRFKKQTRKAKTIQQLTQTYTVVLLSILFLPILLFLYFLVMFFFVYWYIVTVIRLIFFSILQCTVEVAVVFDFLVFSFIFFALLWTSNVTLCTLCFFFF